ncbi:MAG: dipeptidase PepV [Oscillospiraceae bacterium]|nr:dipeptidase PepV [Oscillospiraceae bacterium]
MKGYSEMDFKRRISDYIDSAREEMISDLRTLVRIPSVMGEAKENMPFGERTAEALNAALEICEKSGFSVHNTDNYVGTADFFPDKENYLGILCHMDVVPEGNGWSVPPFELTEKDGKLIGRGAIDDKGPAIAAIYAMKAIKSLGIPIKKNVRLIIGTNEENGSADLEYYRKREELPTLLFTPDGSYPVINIEKGMLRMSLTQKITDSRLENLSAGIAVNAVPETAEAVISGVGLQAAENAAERLSLPVKVSFLEENGRIKMSVLGKSAHASTPESGENALAAALAVLSALGITEARALAELFPYGETDGLSCGIKCSDEISGETTTVLSMAEVEDGSLICRQDIRFPVCESCGGIIARLTETAGAKGIRVFADMKSEPHSVSAESEFVKTLLEVYEDVTGERGYPVAIGGGTYVHDTENGVAFGAEFPDEDNNMHGADEFIKEENLLLNAKIYANAILRLCEKE